MALRNRIAQALTVTYVVLIRLTAFEPVAVSARTPSPARAFLRRLPRRLRSGGIVAGCAVAAAPDENVEFKYREGEGRRRHRQRLAANAEATMWLDGQHKLSACLAERTGGTFNLNQTPSVAGQHAVLVAHRAALAAFQVEIADQPLA